MTAPCRAAPLLIALAVAWPDLGVATGHAEEMTLYSTREPQLVAPVIETFTSATGIKVQLVHIEDNLVQRLASEGDASPADVLMTIGLDKISQFPARGLTQKLTSPALDKAIPAALRNVDAQWIALSVRPRVIVTRADAAQAAIRYEDLADAK